jgi:hypothetical protein
MALNFLKFSGLTALSNDTTIAGRAPFSKNFRLCVEPALSEVISLSTGVSQDMPRNRAVGSGIGE